jgi:hypothetical protein
MVQIDADPGPAARHFGVPYPEGYVVVVLPDLARAEAATVALHAAGFRAEDVQTRSGEEVLAAESEYAREHPLGQSIGAVLAADEGEAASDDLKAATEGAAILTVRAPDAESAERARIVVAQHAARRVRHYGHSVMTDLPT